MWTTWALYGFRLDWSLEIFINKKQGILRVPDELLTPGSSEPKASWYLLFLIAFQIHSLPGSPSWCELCNQARTRDKRPLGSSDRAAGHPATVLSAGAKGSLEHIASPVTCYIADLTFSQVSKLEDSLPAACDLWVGRRQGVGWSRVPSWPPLKRAAKPQLFWLLITPCFVCCWIERGTEGDCFIGTEET